MGKIIVFDVCGTLYRSNTTIDYVLHVLKNTGSSYFYLLRFLSFPVVSIPMYFLFGFDLRAYAIKVLSGYSRLLLDGLADSFYHQVLISKENKIVFEVFNDMKTKGRVVLASASLDVVVSVIAKNNNVEYVSSILEFESGVCSGLLNKDLLGNKYVAIKKLVGAPSFYSMYSDNKEDLQMKNYFDHYFYVQNIFLSKLSRIIRFQ